MGDRADDEAEEGFADVVASFPADAQAAEAVPPEDRPLDDPAECAQTAAVRFPSFGDQVRRGRRMPQVAPPGRLFAISPAAVDLYAVGVHWALGDAGAALDAGKNLRPEQFPTAERKARLGTDMARAWWAWQRPEQTARALLDAYRASPGEVHDWPAIRRIVIELAERHPGTSGVRELHTAVTRAI